MNEHTELVLKELEENVFPKLAKDGYEAPPVMKFDMPGKKEVAGFVQEGSIMIFMEKSKTHKVTIREIAAKWGLELDCFSLVYPKDPMAPALLTLKLKSKCSNCGARDTK